VTDVRIETERLVLREFRPDDWRAVQEYAADPQVVRHLVWGPNTEEDTRGYIRRALAARDAEPRRGYELAVDLTDEGRLIGAARLEVSDPQNRAGWIGYCFNRRYWGRGFATEAVRAVVDFGFTQLDLHRIFATCAPENSASARVLEKLGMRREGHIVRHKWIRGRWRDSCLYALLEEERRGAARSD
jgi:RimJ/RimL family protein N-acetyltransferase